MFFQSCPLLTWHRDGQQWPRLQGPGYIPLIQHLRRMWKALGSVARLANKKKYVGQYYPRDSDAVQCVQQDWDPTWPGHRQRQSFYCPGSPTTSLGFFSGCLARQEQLLNHRPLWNGSCRQVRACCHEAATGHYCHFRQPPAPCKERFQTPQAQPSIPLFSQPYKNRKNTCSH